VTINNDVKQYWLQKRPGFDAGIAWRIKDIIKREQIDLVNTHLWTANVWGRLAAFLAHVPVVVTEHNMDIWKSQPLRMVDRALAPLTTAMVTVSAEVKGFYVHQAGVAEKKIVVINNGIDVENFTADERLAGLPGRGAVIGMVARLIPDKGHAFFFRALPVVRRHFPHATVLVAGDGPERGALERLAGELAISDAVTFLGTRTSDLAGLYHQCDLIVQPSLREGLSLTLLEALACGRPVVTTDVGSNRTVVCRDELGTVVPPRDVPALVAATVAWLSRPVDPSAAARRNAWVREQFSSEHMVRGYEDLFLRLVRA
jgi:glycosyltransferase involved in cell wall biosynthesis